jgi:hypothetical protein
LAGFGIRFPLSPFGRACTITVRASDGSDNPLTFRTGRGNAISVSDVDVEAYNPQVYLGVSHGTPTQSGTAGLSVRGNGTPRQPPSNTGLIAFGIAANRASMTTAFH